MRKTLTALAISGLLSSQATAHSWLEQLQVIDDNGDYTGNPGYPRGYFPRGTSGFSDTKMTYLIPALSSGRIRVDNTDLLCAPTQRQANSNAATYPILSAQAGNYVAMKYLENGHVSLPHTQTGKAGSGGLVYIYGTTNPSPEQKITDVASWTPTSDLATGRLLGIQTYDDGRCYQINPNSPISVARQAQFPDPIPNQPGSHAEQWCESDIKIPSDAPAGSLTLYWVWQWPTLPGMDPGIPNGKDETYTTCSDIQVVAAGANLKAVNSAAVPLILQDPQEAAPTDFKVRAANLTAPANTMFLGVGGSAGNVATAAASTTTAAAAAASTTTTNTPTPPPSNPTTFITSTITASTTTTTPPPSNPTTFITSTVTDSSPAPNVALEVIESTSIIEVPITQQYATATTTTTQPRILTKTTLATVTVMETVYGRGVPLTDTSIQATGLPN